MNAARLIGSRHADWGVPNGIRRGTALHRPVSERYLGFQLQRVKAGSEPHCLGVEAMKMMDGGFGCLAAIRVMHKAAGRVTA